VWKANCGDEDSKQHEKFGVDVEVTRCASVENYLSSVLQDESRSMVPDTELSREISQTRFHPSVAYRLPSVPGSDSAWP
jgi:hypothetical protein